MKPMIRWVWRFGIGFLFIALLVSGCPPSSPYERDWILKKGDYPTATLYGFGDNGESCQVIASNFNGEAASSGGTVELRPDSGGVGIAVRPTTWICSPRRTWLEVMLGIHP